MSLPPTPSSGSEDCIKKEAAAATNHYQTALTQCLTIEGDTVQKIEFDCMLDATVNQMQLIGQLCKNLRTIGPKEDESYY